MNEVFDSQEAMLAHVMGVAGEIARKNPLAVTGCKTLINYGRDHSTADTLQFVGVWNGGMLSTAHIREAASAQSEKREARYDDLLPVRTTPM